MCGRYAITTAPEAIRRLFGITGPTPNFAAHYNAAPGLELPVVRRDPKSGERVLSPLLWGLIPYWAKDRKIAWRTINARGETVKTAAAFKSAYVKRRCLVPADAFYEWKKIGKGKQPYAIAMRDRQPFALAGLWENWKDQASGQWVRTFTILTTAPNALVAPLHDRMPVSSRRERLRALARRGARPGGSDPALSGRRHDRLAGVDPRQQGRQRRRRDP
jgi:putative SOS response-associated peptidase YedK